MLKIHWIGPLVVLILLILPLQSHSQADKLYEKGLKAFYSEDFAKAIDYFEQVEATGRSIKDTKYRKELSYLVQKDFRERDLSTILAFRESKGKTDKFYHYWMGRVYANRYMFPEAVESWKIFLSMRAVKSEEIIEETTNFLQHAEEMVSFFDNPDNYEVHQLGAPINSKNAELAPAFSAENDRLIFMSNRNNLSKDEFQIFQSNSTDSGWNTPEAVDILGTFTRDKANLEIVNEDGKLFIYQDIKKGDLFYSEFIDEQWTTPKEFDSNISSTKLGSHFFINEHEDRIIFSSPNKANGLDLLEAFRDHETGQWEKPHPFSSNVNSAYDEDSPFLSADETRFYFCSDKPNGLGGFDVYESVFDPINKTWSEPQNMGWPINSPDDELHFKMNPDNSSGYFASNRIHSLGDYDIYYFWEIQKTKIEGKVLFAHNDAPVKTGEIRFHPTQYLDEYFRSKIDENGKYKTEVISNEIFRVEILQGFDTILTQPFAVEEIEGKSVTHFKDFHVIDKNLSAEERRRLEEKYAYEQIEPTLSKAPNTINKEEINKPAPPVKETTQMITPKIKPSDIPSVTNFSAQSTTRLTNIYFEFGTSQLRKDSDSALNNLYTFLSNNSKVTIEIAGHTDNIGTKEANKIVSKNRAESVKAWLIEKGIASNRIQTVGFGESHPLASNDDEKDGRALNRRIEVRLTN